MAVAAMGSSETLIDFTVLVHPAEMAFTPICPVVGKADENVRIANDSFGGPFMTAPLEKLQE